LQRRNFFQGRSIRGLDIKDVSWFSPNGQQMSDEAWNAGFVKSLGVRLDGELIGEMNERGEPITGDTLLLLLNAHHDSIPFLLPITKVDQEWEVLLDTSTPSGGPPAVVESKEEYLLRGRSMVLLRSRQTAPPQAAESAEPAALTPEPALASAEA
jgi:glycogen operon protein